MGKNRNWQKRVEVADARREEAKQRKQRSEDRRQFKQWVTQDLLPLLDRHGRRPLRLHVWTDTIASDSPPLLDIVGGGGGGGGANYYNNEHNKKGGRAHRSMSFENESTVMGSANQLGDQQHQRGWSGSISDGKKGKKKAHPRSKESSPATPEKMLEQERAAAAAAASPLLCRSHFFRSRCEESSSSSCRKNSRGSGGCGCRYLHYSSSYKTLGSALHVNKRSTPDSIKREIQFTESAAEAAVPDDVSRTDPGAMEMVYYLDVELKGKTESDEDAEKQREEQQQQQSISEELYEALSTRNIKLASIVYVALDNVLVFDRYREGVLLNDREFLFAVAGVEGGGNRRLSVESEGDISIEEAVNMLPGPILEHMLTYLPDYAVASVSQVCKAWSHEIKQSPNLWKHLLIRKHWPVPESAPDNCEINPQVFRSAFVEHYIAMRDVNAIKSGLSALTTNSKATHEEAKEMCYQDFSARKSAPSENNSCVSVQVWSPKRVLAAYSRDCSLRLFGTLARGGDNADEMMCRELVSVRVDPYKNTKRRSAQLVSMGLDEESIGCLCHVSADNVEAEAYILVVVSRDDFLLGGSADSGSMVDDVKLNVIDIGEAVLNYILSFDVVDHRMLQLIDFLSDGGEIGDIEVLVSRTIAACGYGRFMIEVSVSIPVMDTNDIDVQMQLLDRKLVLFSANAGAIVWAGESNDLSRPLRPRREDMTLTYMRHHQPGLSRAACNVAVASISSPAILTSSIEPSGQVHNSRLVEACDLVRDEILSAEEGWEIRSLRHSRPIVITEQDVVAVDVEERLQDNVVVERKSIVSFYPRNPAVSEPSYSTLKLDGDLEAMKIVNLRDNHLVVLCRHYHHRVVSSSNIASEEISLVAIAVYVPTRTEIGRVSLIEGADQADIPEISVINGETIGVALNWKGVIMTGGAVRSVGSSDSIVNHEPPTPRPVKKKKKKKMVSKGAKKDAFARGMTLRG